MPQDVIDILTSNIDTLWVIDCAILVFIMQAGFMCMETGLSRHKNSINVALKNADHGYIIETGKVMLEGTAKSLLNDDKVKEVYLGISKEGRKNFRDVLKEEGKKKKKKVN